MIGPFLPRGICPVRSSSITPWSEFVRPPTGSANKLVHSMWTYAHRIVFPSEIESHVE
jgi:hypothetical protein